MGMVYSKMKNHFIKKQAGSVKKTKVFETTDFPYGDHETQVSEGGEADLHKHLVGCQKNPGHTEFIPIKTFSVNHLPEELQSKTLYDYIKAVADLTVRVDVKTTSPHRPEFYPDTNVPYPYYTMRNKTTFRLGSGEITVFKFIKGNALDGFGLKIDTNGHTFYRQFGQSVKTCPCCKCQHSDRPSHVWWEIFIVTTAHVVFDDVEASHTSCRLFYDEPDCPVVSLDKVSVHYVNIDGDFDLLKFVTCDSLGDQLYHMQQHKLYLLVNIRKQLKKKPGIKFTFIVSHPHGCPKQVSLGYLSGIRKVRGYNKDIDFTQMTYTTFTCPGSSGARVNNLHFCGHIHSGSYKRIINYSAVGLNRK